MECDAKILLQRIDDYFTGTISKTDLGKWAENDIEDIYPCTEENVATIRDILHGKRNYDFAVEMSVPIQTYYLSDKD